ncbi:hypothetical protein Angca_001441, partial [Angiostrongylus cantonensis]
ISLYRVKIDCSKIHGSKYVSPAVLVNIEPETMDSVCSESYVQLLRLDNYVVG